MLRNGTELLCSSSQLGKSCHDNNFVDQLGSRDQLSHPTGDALTAFSRLMQAKIDLERPYHDEAVELTKFLLRAHLANKS